MKASFEIPLLRGGISRATQKSVWTSGWLFNAYQNCRCWLFKLNKAWLTTHFIATRRAILKQWTPATPLTITDVKAGLLGLLRKAKLAVALSHHSHLPPFHRKWNKYIAKVFPVNRFRPPTSELWATTLSTLPLND